jgi:hypothetical protein
MRSIVILGSCAFLALSIGTAAAGQCTSEIESLSKTLAAKDAGSGPTASGAANPGQHPPTAATSAADTSTTASTSAAKSNQPQHPPTASMNTAASSLGSKSGADTAKPREEHPPTAAMNEATKGSAASPQDVQRQTAGQPTAAQQAQGSTGSPNQQSASELLEQARGFDKAGQEGRCMDAIQQAKRLAG